MSRPTDEALRAAFDHFDKFGYCVVKSLLSPEKCAAVRAGIHAYLKEAGIDVADPTLKPNNWPHTAAGILQRVGVGQCEAVWLVREDENVRYVFTKAHGDNDLLVSTDGVCIQPINLRDTGAPLHTDQSHTRKGRLYMQGLINLTPALDEGTGTLEVIPGSHLKHAEFGALFGSTSKDDFVQYKPTDYEFLGGQPVRVFADVGDAVFWDSRTAHRGAPPPVKLPPHITPGERDVVYVCMGPRRVEPKSAFNKMRAIYKNRRMTSHKPGGRHMFPAKVNTWRKPHLRPTRIPEKDDRSGSAAQLELAGVTSLTTRKRVVETPWLKFDYVDAKK